MINTPSPLATVCLLTFVSAVAVTDLRQRRIPNLLTVPAALVGLATNLSSSGATGLLVASSGLLVGLLVLLPFYLARGFSAGDVKAMAVIGAFLGPKGALIAATWILAAGGIAAVVVLIGKGSAVHAFIRRSLQQGVGASPAARAAALQTSDADATPYRFPYGLAIACGTFAAITWS